MSLYANVVSRIGEQAQRKKDGKFNGIPFPYARFGRYLPSIDKEQVIGLTSFSGAGKSKFARYNFVMHPYEFSLKHNYPLLIDYYALEDSAEKVYMNILCNYLFMKHGLKVSLWDLQSKFKELPPLYLAKIKEGEKYMQDFSNVVRIKDSVANPYGIYKDVLATAETLGEILYTTKEFDGQTKSQITGFKPKDDTHWMIICDNLNNLEAEKHHKDDREAMNNFVQKDCRMKYAKIFKATCIIIHQQALEAERQQFTSSGGSIIEKIKPSIANLGGTKEVVRAYHVLLSLFNPHKFKIPSLNGYDTQNIGNNFRELNILKANDGFDNVSTSLYFDGASEFFRELPHPEKEKDELQKFYAWLANERLAASNKSLLF